MQNFNKKPTATVWEWIMWGCVEVCVCVCVFVCVCERERMYMCMAGYIRTKIFLVKCCNEQYIHFIIKMKHRSLFLFGCISSKTRSVVLKLLKERDQGNSCIWFGNNSADLVIKKKKEKEKTQLDSGSQSALSYAILI